MRDSRRTSSSQLKGARLTLSLNVAIGAVAVLPVILFLYHASLFREIECQETDNLCNNLNSPLVFALWGTIQTFSPGGSKSLFLTALLLAFVLSCIVNILAWRGRQPAPR